MSKCFVRGYAERGKFLWHIDNLGILGYNFTLQGRYALRLQERSLEGRYGYSHGKD
jgi:hypothetical protein